MKLGLITDIHEHVEYLQLALDHFQRDAVDQVVIIGDIFEMGERIEETCRLLAAANAVGVWGNHDIGLCQHVKEEVRQRYGPTVIDYMTSLKPRLEIAGCLFQHVEPWLNAEDLMELWYVEGPPDSEDGLRRIFDAGPQRLMFAGHYHRWLLATPEALSDWRGECSLDLSPPQRFFIVIGALCEGRYVICDTDTHEMRPFHL